MLLIIAVVLGLLWLLGLVAIHIASPLFHLLIVIAVVVFIYDLIVKRRA
jgi:Family of unknown function (DUF5670)